MKIRLYTLPNMITLLNLLCGCIAICVMLIHGNIGLGFMLICLAALFDFCDGLAARLTGSYSETGKQLDSLADMISFGVAPSSALFALFVAGGGQEMHAYPIFILACFSALRLAKFNVDDSQKTTFVGLPTPAMAIFVASAAYIATKENIMVPDYVIYSVVAILSFLMVCNVEMFALKFEQYSFKSNQIRYCFLLASALALILCGVLALPFIIATYVLVSTVLWLTKKG